MSIVIENLRLKYPDSDSRLFTDLSLHIATGEKVLLVGPSGSGKTTLINVLGGLIPNVIEVPMKADTIEASSGAYVFQDPDSQFTMPTVAEELAFILENQGVPRDAMDVQFDSVLQTVKLDVKGTQLIHTLSGGMKQKLAIASALLQRRDILYLDEPTSMLDSASAKHLWQTIVDVWEDKTVVIVEHRVEYIWDIVDRVILMNEKGEIVHQGSPQEVLYNHRDMLDDFGVWHPLSWDNAPDLKLGNITGETALHIKNMHIQRGASALVAIDELSISSGEWITLEGDNGTGKTSLLLAIMRLLKTDGAITFMGERMNKTRDFRGRVYPVFQNPELQFMTNSVLDEVAINHERELPRAEALKEAQTLLTTLGLLHLCQLHPLEISTGQKRRLSVATAMSAVPQIIILDEPTFGLDQRATFTVLRLFHSLVASGITIIMITHDEEIKTRYPTRRLRITSGILKDSGQNDV